MNVEPPYVYGVHGVAEIDDGVGDRIVVAARDVLTERNEQKRLKVQADMRPVRDPDEIVEEFLDKAVYAGETGTLSLRSALGYHGKHRMLRVQSMGRELVSDDPGYPDALIESGFGAIHGFALRWGFPICVDKYGFMTWEYAWDSLCDKMKRKVENDVQNAKEGQIDFAGVREAFKSYMVVSLQFVGKLEVRIREEGGTANSTEPRYIGYDEEGGAFKRSRTWMDDTDVMDHLWIRSCQFKKNTYDGTRYLCDSPIEYERHLTFPSGQACGFTGLVYLTEARWIAPLPSYPKLPRFCKSRRDLWKNFAAAKAADSDTYDVAIEATDTSDGSEPPRSPTGKCV
eukprot:TRINITY_DN31891_c0_g2_i1.p1 TRINITY_DN31891_c0_g2~~TRINITY_DN31891_c0_g2_i1.p1  ORF type:complete len:342 (+),score=26.77 TRINITY_DN31891_c0_g2_i1:234-1259(+)